METVSSGLVIPVSFQLDRYWLYLREQLIPANKGRLNVQVSVEPYTANAETEWPQSPRSNPQVYFGPQGRD